MATIQEAAKALEEMLSSFAVDLCNSNEQITSIICATNATFWGLDEFEDLQIKQTSPSEFTFSVDLSLSGEQLDEKPMCGDALTLVATGTLTHDKLRGWSIDDYSLADVKLNW